MPVAVADPGEPGDGVACATSGASSVTPARYGLRRLVPCPACAAAIQGAAYACLR